MSRIRAWIGWSACAVRPVALAAAGAGILALAATLTARPTLADADTTPPVGTIVINGGSPVTNNAHVSIDATATDDLSGVLTVELSNDGTAWRSNSYPASSGWDISDPTYGGTFAAGLHTVYARWTDAVGNTSAPVSAGITYDPVNPTVAGVTFNAGGTVTNDPSLTIHLNATDNVGLASVRIQTQAPAVRDETLPFAASVPWDLGSSATDGWYDFWITVQDLAGNVTTVFPAVFLDRTPPSILQFMADQPAPDGSIQLTLTASDASEVPSARISPDGGVSWGGALPIVGYKVAWNPLDPAQGGGPMLGQRTILGQVRDAAGNWSASKSLSVFVSAAVSIAVSANPTTGQPITFSAEWAGPVTLPGGAMCLWEFMWGDDASIYLVERNETFGYVMTQGPASAGFCDHWTFTLPWTPVRQYLVSLRVMTSDWTDLGSDTIGSSPGDVAFTSAVGSSSRSISSSNLPTFYVLPDSYELTVGEAAIYRGFAVGGATIKSTDVWTIQYLNTPERHPGSAVLTFYPKTTGHITVCLSREYSASRQLGACFDPPVRRSASSGGGGGATAPPAAASGDPLPSPTGPSPDASGTESGEPSLTPGAVAVGDPSVSPAPDPAAPASTRSPAPALWLLALAAAALLTIGVVVAFVHPASRGHLLSSIRRIRRPGT